MLMMWLPLRGWGMSGRLETGEIWRRIKISIYLKIQNRLARTVDWAIF